MGFTNIGPPRIEKNLVCSHQRNIFAIKTCKENGEIVGHLQRELSRTLKFLLDRGAKTSDVLTSTHYRRSPLTQGGMEIPCKVTVEMSRTLNNMQLMDRLMELMKYLYSEPHSLIIIGSLLADELKVEFLSNKTGQKLPKTGKEEKTREKKSEWNKIIKYQRYVTSPRSEEATS